VACKKGETYLHEVKFTFQLLLVFYPVTRLNLLLIGKQRVLVTSVCSDHHLQCQTVDTVDQGLRTLSDIRKKSSVMFYFILRNIGYVYNIQLVALFILVY
jgi:hypothetical protein